MCSSEIRVKPLHSLTSAYGFTKYAPQIHGASAGSFYSRIYATLTTRSASVRGEGTALVQQLLTPGLGAGFGYHPVNRISPARVKGVPKVTELARLRKSTVI